jgi:hypothetical protein
MIKSSSLDRPVQIVAAGQRCRRPSMQKATPCLQRRLSLAVLLTGAAVWVEAVAALHFQDET